MTMEPSLLSGQRSAAAFKRSEPGTIHRGQVGLPLSALVRLDVRCAADRERAQDRQVDGFTVEAANLAAARYHEEHGSSSLRPRRRMFRRGRSTSRPSKTDWTPASCVAIC